MKSGSCDNAFGPTNLFDFIFLSLYLCFGSGQIMYEWNESLQLRDLVFPSTFQNVSILAKIYKNKIKEKQERASLFCIRRKGNILSKF